MRSTVHSPGFCRGLSESGKTSCGLCYRSSAEDFFVKRPITKLWHRPDFVDDVGREHWDVASSVPNFSCHAQATEVRQQDCFCKARRHGQSILARATGINTVVLVRAEKSVVCHVTRGGCESIESQRAGLVFRAIPGNTIPPIDKAIVVDCADVSAVVRCAGADVIVELTAALCVVDQAPMGRRIVLHLDSLIIDFVRLVSGHDAGVCHALHALHVPFWKIEI